MKKFFISFIFSFIFLFNTVVIANGEPINVKINGKKQSVKTASVVVNGSKLESGYSPYISNDRTFVPIREIVEALGASVSWDNNTQSAEISLNGEIVKLKIDSKVIYVNGEKQSLGDDVVPKMTTYISKKSTAKTVVPLRFLSETLGFTVDWDSKSYVANIDDSKAVGLSEDVQQNSNSLGAINAVEEKKEISKTVTSDGIVTIVLDAGHGGKDPGTKSKDGEVLESELNLIVTSKLAIMLKDKGYEVIETRTTDEFLSLIERSNLANNMNSEIFVSVHFNSSNNSDASGIEVLYAPENKVAIKNEEQIHLAKCILDEVVKTTGAKNRGVKQRADLVVLNQTIMPAALAELGFLSNEQELEEIKNPEYIDKLVLGMYNGIVKYADNYIE